jgi:uncharacterized protein (TIGR01244 family)
LFPTRPYLWPGVPLGILLALLWVTVPAAADGEDLPPLAQHLVQVDADLLIAGELNLDALAARRAGSTTIIDLRTAEEGVADERVAVESLGMRYVNVPVDGAEIRDDDVARLRTLLDAASGQPVILHCASGNRAAMLWGAIQLDDGRSLDDVMSAVSEVATKPAVRDALRARARGEPAKNAATAAPRGEAAP